MNKPTFLGHARPLRVAMLHTAEPSLCVSRIRTALYDGADAFGLQICQMPVELRTDDNYRKIIRPMGDKPLYVTNYRSQHSASHTDEERAEEMMYALRCGATLLDVMGDQFDPSPLQMTYNPAAVERQKSLIGRIHEAGGEVIMSSHTGCFLPPEKVLDIALAQKERGADIAKIVTNAASDEEMMQNLEAITLMKRELGIPFLFLANGSHYKMQRMIGPMLGCCMWLCVVEYTASCTPTQPLLRAVSRVMENFDYIPER